MSLVIQGIEAGACVLALLFIIAMAIDNDNDRHRPA